MTALHDFIHAHDEATLITALNKGQVIRAKKDVTGGKVALTDEGADQANLSVAGETTILSAKGLTAAKCSCPAAGLCRHVVAAVLFLRENADGSEETAKVADAPPALPDFTMAQVEKFAGKDWVRALQNADNHAILTLTTSTTVEFPDTSETVTFPVGLPLKDALFKGPRSARKRLAVALAALMVLREKGETLPEAVIETQTTPVADERLLNLASAALEQAAQSLASGNTRQSRERLFSIAITSRTEALPRLAAELRGLSELLDPEALRRADVTPTDALMRLGRSYALCQALRNAPDDPILMGTGARSFTPSGPRDYVLIGAEHWRTDAGARGFTLTLRDLENGRFVQALQARAAGTDLTFHAAGLWHHAIWSGVRPSDHMGCHLHFADAALSAQGDPGLSQTAEIRGTAASQTSEEIRNWMDVPVAIDKHLGLGLRQRIGDAPMILSPTRCDPPYLDEYRQRYVWTWYDTEDRPMTLLLPEQQHGFSVLDNCKPVAGLVRVGKGGEARLISLWTSDQQTPYALQFTMPPRPKGLAAGLRNLTRKFQQAAPDAPDRSDPLDLLRERLLETALMRIGQPPHPWPDHLTREARDRGLGSIHRIAEADDTGPETALKLGYLLSILQNAN